MSTNLPSKHTIGSEYWYVLLAVTEGQRSVSITDCGWLSYKREVWHAVKPGLTHHFLRKMPVPSQEYDSCFPLVPCVDIVERLSSVLSVLTDFPFRLCLGVQYFVITIITQLGAEIHVSSEPGCRTEMISVPGIEGDIYLPSISQKYEDEGIHDVFPSIVNR